MIDKKYQLVIFDVDGTLYHQPKLRLIMLIHLIAHYLFKPHKITELNVLKVFRKEREINAHKGHGNIAEEQYKWAANKLNYNETKVKDIVEFWMHKKPLRYLRSCVFENVRTLINELNKIAQTAVYSDYLAHHKIKAMELNINHCFSSEQKEINTLKPNSKGILHILNHFNVDKSQALLIGDRDELDGACARNAGIDYIIVNHKTANEIYKNMTEDVRRLSK